MFGLAEDIAGDQCRIGVVVGNDRDLRRAGQEVDAALPEQLSLGFGNELIAGAAEHVGRRDDAHAVCHQREGLDSSQDEDSIGSGLLHGVDRCRIIALPFDRRGAADDGSYSGHFRGNNAHLSGSEHRITPAGDVAAHAIDRDMLVSQDDPRANLHLQRR